MPRLRARGLAGSIACGTRKPANKAPVSHCLGQGRQRRGVRGQHSAGVAQDAVDGRDGVGGATWASVTLPRVP